MLVPICLLLSQTPLKIDLEMRASRLPVLVEALAAKTNEKLFCSPQLGRHILLVKLDSVTPSEARQKIAEAVDAEWQDRNGTLTLLRTAAKDRELQALWRSRQAKAMEGALAKLFEQFDKAPKFDAAAAQKLLADLKAQDERAKDDERGGFADWYRLAMEHARGPGGRAVVRVLKLLGPEGLADLPVGRTVLAVNPTNLQRPLPRATQDILRTWKQEQDIWEVAMEGQAEERQGMRLGSDPRLSRFGEGDVARILLVATKYGPKSNINFDLQGFDGAGSFICRASISSNPPAFTPERLLKMSEFAKAKGTYVLSKEALERHSFSRLDYQETKRPSEEWVKILSDPVTRDPLSFEHSELLLALAQQTKRNIVASLSDDLRIPALDEPNPGPLNLDAYLKYNETVLAIEVAQDDRWIVIKPWSQLGPPILPEDRFAVKKLLQSGLATGYFSLEAMGEHAASASDEWNATSFHLARVLLPRSERILQEASVKALRFYGSLSPTQQRSLRDGQPVDLIALSPSARQALQQVVLSPDGSGRNGGLYINGEYMGGRLETNLNCEPTEFLAGPPSGGTIKPTVATDDPLLVGTIGGAYVAWTRFIKPERLAAAMKSDRAAYTKNDDYWLGTTLDLKIDVKISREAEFRMTLTEHRYDLRKEGVKMEKLPEEVRKKIDGG
jgi:hypothetical protein